VRSQRCEESEALVKASRLQEVIEGAIELDGFFVDTDVVGCKVSSALGLVLRRYTPLAKANVPVSQQTENFEKSLGLPTSPACHAYQRLTLKTLAESRC
jgi:hypothetical protein